MSSSASPTDPLDAPELAPATGNKSGSIRTPKSTVWFAAGAAFVAALAFLWPRRAPGLTFEDSGLLASVASVFGIPHPPGYPLWTMLGGLATRLGGVFGLEPAAATNSLSTVASAGACAVLAGFAASRGAGAALGAACGLVLLVSNTFLAQSAGTEVYALATLVQLSFVALALSSAPRPFYVGAAFGLAACAHLTSLLLVPLMLRSVRSFSATGRLALGLGAGLLPFLYVPLRSLADPAIDWGDPDTFERLLAHLGRLQYSGDFEPDRKGAVAFLLDQGPWQVLGPLVLAIGLTGRLLIRDRRAVGQIGWLLATTAGICAGLVAKAAYPEMLESVRWRLAGSHQVLVVALAVWVALAVSRASASWTGRSTRAALGAGLLAAGLATPSPATKLPTDLSSAYGASRYARGVLDQAPADAFLWINRLGSTDILGFPLLYRQVALQERPDLVLIDRSALEMGWYREQLAERAPQLKPALDQLGRALESGDLLAPSERRRASGLVFLAARADPRPLVATDPPGPAILGREPLHPAGLLWWDSAPESELLPRRVDLTGEPRSPWTDLLKKLAAERARP